MFKRRKYGEIEAVSHNPQSLDQRVAGRRGDAALVVLVAHHQNVALETPGTTPAVLDDPEVLGVLSAVSDSENTMVQIGASQKQEQRLLFVTVTFRLNHSNTSNRNERKTKRKSSTRVPAAQNRIVDTTTVQLEGNVAGIDGNRHRSGSSNCCLQVRLAAVLHVSEARNAGHSLGLVVLARAVLRKNFIPKLTRPNQVQAE